MPTPTISSARSTRRAERTRARAYPISYALRSLGATAAEENIAFIHRGLDAFSRGDLEVGAELTQPDVEWHLSFRLPDLPVGKTVYRGPDEVMRVWAAFRSVWDELSVTLEEVIEAHEDVVVVRARFVGRGSASGVEVDRTLFYVRCWEAEATAAVLHRGRGFGRAGSEGVRR